MRNLGVRACVLAGPSLMSPRFCQGVLPRTAWHSTASSANEPRAVCALPACLPAVRVRVRAGD